ncbi:MAG: DUF4199 domain-containing protein [Bacteroidales bacterium]|nr:DUF4199 domain-containing protein [Bacteroidales bacterium]
MNETKTTPVNFAMQAGIFLGFLGIIKFFLLSYSLIFPSMGLLYLLSALFFHLVVFYYARKFKRDVMEGTIPFFQAWNVSVLMYFFGAILTGAVEFIFYKFINPHFIASYTSKSINAIQEITAKLQEPATKAYLTEISNNIAKGGIPSPIEMTIAHIQNSIFSGIFVSLIIAAILIRKKSSKNNTPTTLSNEDSL